MAFRTATIRNAAGIHCRPSAVIMKTMITCPCTIVLRAPTGDADLRSIYGLLCLGLEPATSVTLEVTGPDEEQWADCLQELLERHYDFPAREEQPTTP